MNQRERYADVVRRDHAVVVALAEQVATADETVRQLAEQLVSKDDQITKLQTQVRALILAKACDLTPDDVGDLPDPEVIRDVEAQGVYKLSRMHLVALVRKKEQTIRALVGKVAETCAERDRFRAMAEHWRVLIERGAVAVLADQDDEEERARKRVEKHERRRAKRRTDAKHGPSARSRRRGSEEQRRVPEVVHAPACHGDADADDSASSDSANDVFHPPLDLIYLLPDPAVAECKILNRKPSTVVSGPPAAILSARTVPADIPESGIAPRALTKLRAEYMALYAERDQLAAALAAVRDEMAAERQEHAAQVAELRAAVRRLKEFLWPGDMGET
ncbi:hypothetical protein AMAG_03692 [Allomyces macrogynus ATCC 38327]|uniref:Uncharacterized protein n=1 Tax=Allomyces macrogynus (strain ATCC 38327) TaxID=578462 RepID=A0A0L0SAA3_ALLM3|nr:hypothetical protein AMAG_03692 [Allomyces macrogynus ATCC 38327]|eukprot:KNE59411.1 hypothetical protein AMAG_03692 [Allomyces macrogynus ATCC 38327]